MSEDFVLDDGGVVPYVDGLDSDGGDFGDKYAAKGVRNGSVYADKGKATIELFILVELDL